MGTDLLLHVPKRSHYIYPFGLVQFVNFMPVGLIPIAAYSTDNGYPTKIIHLGLEKILNSKYEISEDIKRHDPKVIGISLHWHHSSHDAIELAKKIKLKHKDIFIVLGGYTASFFAREILEQFLFIDGVIRGEGEIPWLMLSKEINQQGSLRNVKNLTWRNNGSIIENEISYVCDTPFLNYLKYAQFDLVENYKFLPSLFWFFLLNNRSFNNVLIKRKILNTFHIPAARGCRYDCFYCGGGKAAVRAISNRNEPALISPQRLIFHVKKALEFGFNRAGLSLDANLPKEYFDDLFNEAVVNKIEDKFWFEFYGLPAEEVLDRLLKTFHKNTGLTISLDTACEDYRKKIKTVFFSNDKFFKALFKIKKSGFRVEIYFTNNIPGESKAMKLETKKMAKKIKRVYPKAEVFFLDFDIDPACPIYFSPERYGVVLTRKKFMDYYRGHSQDRLDAGILTNEGRKIVAKRFPAFWKGLMVCIIRMLSATPFVVLLLKLLLFTAGVKIKGPKNAS